MFENIVNILKCPKCKRNLKLKSSKKEGKEVLEGLLTCYEGHSWPIREGVIDFQAQEQKNSNNWSEMYQEVDYEELDRQILEKTPNNQRDLTQKACNYIINNINQRKSKVVLDIATGRGTLLLEMIKNMDSEVELICADLSFEVLKYDRVKVKKINPKIEINYIACDATDLPLVDNSIDTAVSLFGIANMGPVTQNGIKEAKRVLKAGGQLLDTHIIVDNIDKVREIVDLINEQHDLEINLDGAEITYNQVKDGHMKADYSDVEIITIGESQGQYNELDLIPPEGEWFAVVVAKCKK